MVWALHRRNFLSAPRVDVFEQLNDHLLACCLGQRSAAHRPPVMTIGEAWDARKGSFAAAADHDFDTHALLGGPHRVQPGGVREQPLLGASDQTYPDLVLKAYPFRVDILSLKR